MTVGYKEWYLVCKALGEGRQHVLLRKGGIAEGRDGFAFKHDAFYLFPSYFHSQASRLRTGEENGEGACEAPPLSDPLAQEGQVVVRWFAKIAETRLLNSWEQAMALEPFHIWKRELVRERFDYEDEPHLHYALVRIHELPEPWSFPDHRSFGGCRSWLQLPDPPSSHGAGMQPVLSDAAFEELKESIRDNLSP